MIVSEPLAEKDLCCAVAAKSEGATWEQIYQMFPNSTAQLRVFGSTARQMGAFCYKWMPDWSPSFRVDEAAALRAILRNYVQKNDPNYRLPEWMAN